MKKIVVIKGSSLGDILTGIPMLKSLKKHWPDSRISLVHGYEGNGIGLIKSSPYIDKDVIINFSMAGLRTLLKLRGERPDIVIDAFPNTRESSLLSLFLGAPIRASYRNLRNASSFVYNIMVEPIGDAIELEGRILQKLGIAGTDKMEIDVPRNCEKIAKSGLLIGINPGKDGNFCRTWTEENWTLLIKEIRKKYQCTIILLGGRDNAASGEYIERNSVNVINLIGKTDIDGLICAINQCDAFISINGGPMHVAAALSKPQIALNGPSLEEWNPHNPNAICLGGRKFCSTRCNDNGCHYGDARCIKTITPAQVMEKLELLIGKPPTVPPRF